VAEELAITILSTLTNGNFKDRVDHGQQKFDQTAIGAASNVVSVGTSEEDVTTGDLSTLGWCFMRNLDATNYVTYGPKSSGSMVGMGRIEAGEVHAFRLEPGITLRWAANTATCLVDLRIYED
tara:strand:- start:3537 stop:3905 length:369 start_codon:yes stop_codon:yes gene_type:complete